MKSNSKMGSGNLSATPELTAHQLFQSHVVNCQGCYGYFERVEIDDKKKVNQRNLCAVGALLYQRAKAEDANVSSGQKPRFPFVAKMYERVMVNVGGVWQEARVIDLSIRAAHQYEKFDPETGLIHWARAAEKVIGYEVENHKGRYYVNSDNVMKLPQPSVGIENRRTQLSVKQPGQAVAGSTPAQRTNSPRRIVIK